MFATSLEIQKYVFMRELKRMAELNPGSGLPRLLRMEPYRGYFELAQ